MNQNQNKPNWLVIILVAALVFFIFKGSGNNPGPGPQPVPNNVADVAEDSIHRYAELLSGDMESLSAQVGAGTLKSAKDIQQEARKLTENSREEAFSKISELDNKFIPALITEENKASVSKYLTEKAKGHKRASN